MPNLNLSRLPPRPLGIIPLDSNLLRSFRHSSMPQKCSPLLLPRLLARRPHPKGTKTFLMWLHQAIWISRKRRTPLVSSLHLLGRLVAPLTPHSTLAPPHHRLNSSRLELSRFRYLLRDFLPRLTLVSYPYREERLIFSMTKATYFDVRNPRYL